MERRGVNLTDYREKRWKVQTVKNLSGLTGCLLLSSLLAGGVYFHFLQISGKNRPLATDNQQRQSQLSVLDAQIASLKAVRQTEQVVTLSRSAITAFMTLIAQLPLHQGGLELVQLSHSQKPNLKIVGVLSEQADFKRLEDYLLAHKGVVVTIEHFQINEENKVEFSLLIQGEGKL